jgi:putative transposase
MELDEVKELKALRDENARLKRLVADQALNIQVLKEVNAKKW